jgi:hypothetical protein
MATTRQIQTILKTTFSIVPIVAGLDKFTNLLTNWADYLNNGLKHMLPIDASAFMKIVGVIEIIAGIIVWVKPKIGGYIVMAWLICIAFQLIPGGRYLDVAVRDLVMAVGVFSLAELSKQVVNT